MKSTRFVALFAASCLAWGTALGCELFDKKDDTVTCVCTTNGGLAGCTTTGGAAGAGNTGGADGGSGDSGAAGAGAMAGMSGAVGGAGQAGAAGMAGASGTGGTAGSAGSGGVMGGSPSTGGDAGGGGDVTPGVACGEACSTSADCRMFTVDLGYRCNLTTSRCEKLALPCRSSLECIPDASAWLQDCGEDEDCFFFAGTVCVDVAGYGKCALPVPEGDGQCEPQTPDHVEFRRFNSSEVIEVCADGSLMCHEGRCIVPCRADDQCTPERNGSVCNTETGLCECVEDDDCAGPGVSRCNTDTGRCECASDDDCDSVSNTDSCIGGRCGCSSVAACVGERTFSGTSYVCE